MDEASTGTLTTGTLSTGTLTTGTLSTAIDPTGDWVEAARAAAVVGSLETWVLSSTLRVTDSDDEAERHILRGLD